MSPVVLLSGALANKPFNGGNAWSRLGWILGFKRLGFNVFFVEQISAASCVDAGDAATDFANSVNVAWFKTVMGQFGLGHSAALICDDGAQVWGLGLDTLEAIARRADLLFNFGGHLTLPELRNGRACKIYYDDDPGFTQFWHASGCPGMHLEGHDFFFTIGANIGEPDCAIPANGIAWHHTRPPAVLAEWPYMQSTQRGFRDSRTEPGRASGRVRFTTVASWRGAYAPIQYGGKTYGLKAHQFRKFLDLPARTGERFEIALQIHPADKKDLDSLLAHGWRIADPRQVAATPSAFRRYVWRSGAEFSAAQGVYVETNSGWFSDRTVRYLASGKPALVQETGFSPHIPTGEGLLSFRTLDEATEAARRISSDYSRHCRAARRLAEQYFDSDRVVRRFAEEIGLELPGEIRKAAPRHRISGSQLPAQRSWLHPLGQIDFAHQALP